MAELQQPEPSYQSSSDINTPIPEDGDNNDDTLSLTILYHNQPIALTFPFSATITDLSTTISEDLDIPPSNQKFLCSPKPGLLRPPFKAPDLALSSLTKSKITLLGTTTTELSSIAASIAALKSKQAARASSHRAARKVHATPSRNSARIQEESTYTFATLRPLPYLPNPQKSLRFLERLAADAGIKAAMRKHKFRVGLLTEMDPSQHTTRESRTLGLNRNRGEVIELRLRTDAYDGYRDYKTIRTTLCHELAHNEIGPHNAQFHALWNLIEKEVKENDWRSGGRSLGAEEFYNPEDGGVEEDGECDGGGWEGGEYVLGGGGNGAGSSGQEPMSRREIMAKAAEERMKKMDQAAKTAERDGGSGSSSG